MYHELNVDIQGSGPVLVLVHGVAGSLRIWDPVVKQLAKRYTVVRMDLLGYGYSPKPFIDYTPKTHIEAIRKTLKEHHVAPPYNMVGLSMGVNLVLEYAATWPQEVRGIVGIGFPYFATERQARDSMRDNIWVRLTLERPVVARFFVPIAWWMGRHGIVDVQRFSPIYTKAMAYEALLNPYRVFRSTLLNCMVHNRQQRILEASSKKKRLFINGGADKWAKAESVRQAIRSYPSSTIEIIPNASHNVVVLKPAATVRLITRYVESLKADKG